MTERLRRAVRSLAAAAVVASLVVVVPGAASAQEDGFSDVTGGVHKPAIDVLAAEGLFEDTLCGDGMFCPGEAVTRSTAAVWLIRALESRTPAAGESRFSDVDANEWWAPFVERLAALDIATACESDPLRYCPDDSLIRARMASWLVRAFDLDSASSAGFLDTGGNAHEADIDAVAGARIAVDCRRDPLHFCPDDAVTRAELATILARALDLVPPPAEFGWSLPSHCRKHAPTDLDAAPAQGCPVWWSHLLDLEPSSEGISVGEMQDRLSEVLPYYTARVSDSLSRLSERTREVIAATVARLAAEDPRTAEQMHTISARSGHCGVPASACALIGGINFDYLTDGRWPWVVAVVVHEWAHNRDFYTAPGGVFSVAWCDRMAERLSVAESTGRLVTHMGLLEAAGAAHRAPLVSNPGCAEALIARFAPEVGSHDRPRYIAELSANAQTQAWMRRGYASPEARWWAAEAAAGYPRETEPLEHPLSRGPLPEPPAEPPEPSDCNDGMHEHPFRPDVRHYHSGGLEPHTHDRRHIVVDGVAVPSDVAVPAGTGCEYADGRRVIAGWTYDRDTRIGDRVDVDHAAYSPDGQWRHADIGRCVIAAIPAHPGHGPPAGNGTSALDRRSVCDQGTEAVWVLCGGAGSRHPCPTEEMFADGEYDGDWIACGESRPGRPFDDICRRTNRQPRAR